MSKGRIIISSVLILGILLLTDIQSAPAAGTQKSASEIRIESSRLLVRDRTVLAGGRRKVYTLESRNPGFSKLRVNAVGYADISVKLLDSGNYSFYQAGKPFESIPSVSETIRKMKFFFFDLPRPGTYYLIVGMDKDVSPRQITVFASGIYEQPPEEDSRLYALYKNFYESVRESVIFPDFSITVGGCGEENSFSVPGIFICEELLAGLPEEGRDYLAIWVASHELGHNLLKIWGSPLWKNEEAADELGTVILSVTPYRQRVIEAVTRMIDEKTQHHLLDDRRWLMLLNRAKKTTAWLIAPEQLRARWADFLMPHVRGDGPSVLRGCFPGFDNEMALCPPDVDPTDPGAGCFQSSIAAPLSAGE